MPLSAEDAQDVAVLVSRLMALGAPIVACQLVILVYRAGLAGRRYTALDFLEVFAGVGAIANGFVSNGFVGTTFDIDNGPSQDINSDVGFLFALALCLRIRDRGLCWLAPLCSSWVWVATGSTHRSLAHPGGLLPSASVTYGNKMVSRCVLLIWMAMADASTRLQKIPCALWSQTPQSRGPCRDSMPRTILTHSVPGIHVRVDADPACARSDCGARATHGFFDGEVL